MRFMVVGLNHTTAPVEIRERVSISDANLDDVLAMLRNARSVLESVVVSTCNRTEIYCVVSSERAGSDYLTGLLARQAKMPTEGLAPFVYMKTGQEAVHHLFRVTCGLDSMILGETQILGQVRAGYLMAQDQGNVGGLLDRCFRLAIRTGKQAQTETVIGQSPVSVSYAAVQLSRKIVGDLRHRRVLVLGAGKMGALTVQHVCAAGCGEVLLANRSEARALEVAEAQGAQVVRWEGIAAALGKADVVIVTTSAPEYVVTASMVEASQRDRHHHRPLVVIDIAVPRNVDPSVASVRHVYHFDIDDLNGVIAANLEERRRASVEVEKMIGLAMCEYADWLSEQAVVPLIAAIRDKGTRVEASVLESLQRKMPHLSEKDMALIHKHTMSIVNQLLKDPILYMKEQAIQGGADRQVQRFAKLFGVDQALADGVDVDLMDGFHLESGTEGMAGFAATLRNWASSLLFDEDDVHLDTDAVHSVAR